MDSDTLTHTHTHRNQEVVIFLDEEGWWNPGKWTRVVKVELQVGFLVSPSSPFPPLFTVVNRYVKISLIVCIRD